jgi:hypothetical protein
MDIHYFLRSRIAFIRQFYGSASAPFLERKRKIEAQEEPFVPPYSEDGEPPFLDEWMEADESLHILAYSCVSMLASALHLFLEAWVGQSGVAVDESLKKSVFKNHGWLSGYNAHFTNRFGVAFGNGPANLRVLEEVVLARNRIEHPYSITDQKTQYSKSDMKKLSHPLFVDKTEIALLNLSEDEEPRWFMPPTVHVTESQLLAAVAEVEKFAEWFDTEIDRVVYAR